jgi:hypothetical protein
VLALHNAVMYPSIKVHFSLRPRDKVALKKTLDAADEAATTSLFNVAKKMIGKKGKAPSPSETKLHGMDALLAYGSDWRAATTAKNTGRQLKPLIDAITIEVDIVDKYRQHLIDSHVLVALLRDKLEEAILRCERVAAVSQVAGSSGDNAGKVATLGNRKSPVYWDRIAVPTKTTESQTLVSQELQKQHDKVKVDLDERQRDREAILKSVKQLTSMSIAKLGSGSKSPVAEEVADAINALVRVR